jgi:hypothetical protein
MIVPTATETQVMQNIMDAAMRDNPNEDGDLSTYAQYFTVLKGMTDAEKKDAIWKAHESMSTPRFGYTRPVETIGRTRRVILRLISVKT